VNQEELNRFENPLIHREKFQKGWGMKKENDVEKENSSRGKEGKKKEENPLMRDCQKD